MKSKMLKIMAVILSLFLVCYAGIQAWIFFYNPYQTEIAVNYSVNEVLHVNGIAVRTETVIEDNYGGSVSYIHEDAAKVLKNKPVAYAHASSDTVKKMERASELEKEINLLEEASSGVSQLYGSSEFINDQIGNSVLAYSHAIASGNYSSFSEINETISFQSLHLFFFQPPPLLPIQPLRQSALPLADVSFQLRTCSICH